MANASPKDKGTRRHTKKLGNKEKNPACTLSLSAFDYTDEEMTPMDIDTDPFAESTPKANPAMETGAIHTTPLQPAQPQPSPHNGRNPAPREDHNPTQREPKTPFAQEQNTPAPANTPHTNTQQPTPHQRGSHHNRDEAADRLDYDESSLMRETSPPIPLETDNHQLEEDASELWIETTAENVTTNGKGLKRTATPEGGWPQIHLAAAPTYNIAPSTLRDWEEIEGPTLWARLYRGKYEPTVAGKTGTIDACKNIIKNLVYIEYDEDLAVMFPDQDLPADNDNKFPHPYHLLIFGLNQQQIDRLTNLQIVSTPEASFIFLPNQAPRPLYILTISGLTYQNTPRAKTLVENLARRAFRDNPEIRAFLEGRTDDGAEETIYHTLDSIHTSFILLKKRNEHNRAWNIYFSVDPGFNDEDYNLLRQKMRQCKFNTVGFGKGYALTGKQQPLCTGCKYVDHDLENCPFSKIPGCFRYKPGGTQDTAGATDFVDAVPQEESPSAKPQNWETNRNYNARRERTGFFAKRGRGQA
ncbi:hypothetical protein C0993_002528 [Termitomyces sp. T159_Od127]|nr:hypothetical protein C0993_002528 [Termitomyces sp. T159_Od127]